MSIKESHGVWLLKYPDGGMLQSQDDGDMIKRDSEGNQFQLTEKQTLLICALAGLRHSSLRSFARFYD